MGKESASFRIDTARLTTLSDKLGVAKTDLIEKALHAYEALRNEALKSLQQRFTREEIIALVDQQNSTVLSPKYQGQVKLYLYGLEDNEKLNQMSSRWKVDYNTLKGKIEDLSANDVYFLQEEIARFWNEPKAFGSPTPDLNKFIDFLVPYVQDPKWYSAFYDGTDWKLTSPMLGFSTEQEAIESIPQDAKDSKISDSIFDVFHLASRPISREEVIKLARNGRKQS